MRLFFIISSAVEISKSNKQKLDHLTVKKKKKTTRKKFCFSLENNYGKVRSVLGSTFILHYFKDP